MSSDPTHAHFSDATPAAPRYRPIPWTLRARRALPALANYVRIARVDHWFKNVFMLPGVLLAWLAVPPADAVAAAGWAALGILATCLVCSSNYTLNELLDAATDRLHPEKRRRPAAAGQIYFPAGYVQWVLLAAAGLALAWLISVQMFLAEVGLFVMGIAYNVKPIRLKEVPYLDVLSESVNNPLRLLLGWYAIRCTLIPPASLVLSYWMLGSYFMAIKRLAEIRHIRDPRAAAAYRKSFAYYNEHRLLISIVTYTAACALCGGVFLIRYRIELLLSIPFLSGFMGYYLHLGFLPNSPAQHPEGLFRHRGLVLYGFVTLIVLVCCLVIRVPWLERLFASTVPAGF